MFRSLAKALAIAAALFVISPCSSWQKTVAQPQGNGYWRDAPPPQWGRGRSPGRGACFYKDADFRNVYFCMSEGQRYSSLPPGFNDQISSIRLFGASSVRIFNDTNFGGMTAMTRRNIINLKNFPLAGYPGKHWNDRVSSIAVFGSGHDEWSGRGRPGPPGENEGWRQVTCPRGRGKSYCAGSRGIRQAEVVTTTAGSRCVEGSTYGIDGNGLWVLRGCSGIFRVR
jgi:hypothetical protein